MRKTLTFGINEHPAPRHTNMTGRMKVVFKPHLSPAPGEREGDWTLEPGKRNGNLVPEMFVLFVGLL